eukprot:scaffold66288_cov69-Phaeocystis_antarctica.AAC.4
MDPPRPSCACPAPHPPPRPAASSARCYIHRRRCRSSFVSAWSCARGARLAGAKIRGILRWTQIPESWLSVYAFPFERPGERVVLRLDVRGECAPDRRAEVVRRIAPINARQHLLGPQRGPVWTHLPVQRRRTPRGHPALAGGRDVLRDHQRLGEANAARQRAQVGFECLGASNKRVGVTARRALP